MGYQEFKTADSAVSIKVKGAVLTNISKEDFQIKESYTHLYNRLWDQANQNIVPLSGESFFFMTNILITPNQTLTKCDEDPHIKEAHCGDHLPPCEPGAFINTGHGANTGQCVESSNEPGIKVCEVEGWCPVEYNVLPLKNNEPVIKGAENFTVFIRNSIYFREFGPEYRRNNILSHSNASYLKTCRYDEITDPLCPIFTLKYLLDKAGESFSDVSSKGAIMTFKINWDCNLNYDFDEYCIPKYTIRRLDKANLNDFEGWNFRYAYQHELDRRTLLKVYGVKFTVEVNAMGQRFSFLPTMINIGTGLALMGLASYLSDIILLYVVKSKKFFKSKKYLSVEEIDNSLENEKNNEEEATEAIALHSQNQQ